MASPAAPAAKRRATYDDVLAAPDNMVAEVLNGELFTSPRPAARHARTSSVIGSDLGSPFDRAPNGPDTPGGWWILDEPELHLGDDVLVPDLAGWRRERLPAIPDVAAFTLAPDWVCEVVSPTTARIDRVRKLPIYLREQVAHLWLVDPSAHTLEIYRHAKERWELVATRGGNEQVRAEPFHAVALDMTRWWIDPQVDTPA